jgi:hypothetical protein
LWLDFDGLLVIYGSILTGCLRFQTLNRASLAALFSGQKSLALKYIGTQMVRDAILSRSFGHFSGL